MKLLIIAVAVGLLLWYALMGREWLKSRPWARGFFAWIEPIEITLYKKSETILVGRLLWLGGLVVTSYDVLAMFAQSLDLTPLTTRIFDVLKIPPDMRSLAGTAFVAALGLIINRMRKRSTMPIELVAVADKDVTPKVAEAIAMADATKVEAVAAVVDAKAAQS